MPDGRINPAGVLKSILKGLRPKLESCANRRLTHVEESWPLHVKRVGRANWPALEQLIGGVLSTEQIDSFMCMVAPFRISTASASQVGPSKISSSSSLSRSDLNTLEEAGLIRRVHHEEAILGRATPFTVAEPGKMRRRWILHPKCFNEEHQSSVKLVNAPFPSLRELLSGGRSRYACSLDFRAFYHQFRISNLAGLQFVFVDSRGAHWAPTTFPTGCTSAPKICQLICIALGRASIPDHLKNEVFFDAFIDNIRFHGNNASHVLECTKRCVSLAQEAGLQFNTDWDHNVVHEKCIPFLGMLFDHVNKTVCLTERFIEKTRANKLELMNSHVLSVGALLSYFGRLIYGARILNIPLAPYFHIFSFVRKTVNTSVSVDEEVKIFPSIKACWVGWFEAVLRNTPRSVSEGLFPLSTSTLFTDASLTGFGGVWFGGNMNVHVFWGRWSRRSVDQAKRAGINMLETRAMRLVLQKVLVKTLTRIKEHVILQYSNMRVFIDNQAAMFAIRKTRSAQFLMNAEVRRIGCITKRLWEEGRIWVDEPQYVRSVDNPADKYSRM
ncbi:MAG: hypothetical protein COA68_12235 [Oceanobacter sp.]|nr:MAG: hypothetical protein COA68_12235 [Oceanobacter sp.]